MKSVVRCCQVLRAAQGEDALPLHTIARRAALPKSLVFRLLYTLQQIGWVEKRDGRTYRLLVHVPRQRRKDIAAPESEPDEAD